MRQSLSKKLWGVLFAMAVTATYAEEKSPSLGFDLSVYGNAATGEKALSRIAGTEVGAFFEHTPLKSIELQVDLSLALESGSSRNLYSEEFNPRQKFRLKEATLNWRPHDSIRFAAGAINQDRWVAPALLKKQTFPSLLESWEHGKVVTFELSAQQSIASDTSNLQPWNELGRNSATFFIERAQVSWQPENGKSVRLTAAHFLFDNLSSQLAYESRFLGNSVIGNGKAGSAFASPFQGFHFGLQGEIPITSRWEAGFHAQYIINTASPLEDRQSWSFQLSQRWKPTDRFFLDGAAEFFRTGTDASPSIYNSRQHGHNNRSGYGLVLSGHWPKDKFSIEAEWYRPEVVSNNGLQEDFQWLAITARTSYDIL